MSREPEEILREDDDGEDEIGAVVEPAAKVETIPDPPKVEDEESEEPEAAEATEPEPVTSELGDAWLEDIQKDGLKKHVFDGLVAKETKRRVDEKLGAELGAFRKEVRAKYRGKQEQLDADLKKAEDYDRVVAELNEARKSTQTPAAQKPVDKAPDEDLNDVAKKFVETYNLRDEQVDMVKGLLDLVDKRQATKPSAKVDVAAELAKLEFVREKEAAEGSEDYKSNGTLRRLAHGYSLEGNSPMTSLNLARKDLGLSKPVVKLRGTPVKGTPAFSRDADSRPIKDIGYKKGEDPLEALKAKYRGE